MNLIGGSLRHAGVVLQGGADTPSGTAPAVAGTGSVLALAKRDPTIELLNTPRASGVVRLRVAGRSGSEATLRLGHGVVVADPGSAVEQLTSEDVTWSLGHLPPSGERVLAFRVPATATGLTTWLQATTATVGGGGFERSNSVSILVRPAVRLKPAADDPRVLPGDAGLVTR